MSLRNRLKIMSDYMAKNFLKNCAMAVMILLCFLLLSIAVLYYENMKYCRKSAERVLTYGIDRTVAIDFNLENEENLKAFLQEAGNSEIIYGIGSWGFGENSFAWTAELREIQKEYKSTAEYDKNSDALKVAGINREALPLLNMKLQKGTEFEKLDYEENVVWLYLGAKYRDIEVGTMYTYELSDGNVLKYIVAGIFKENQEMPKPWMASLTNSSVTASEPFDYGVLMVDGSSVYSNGGCYSYERGKEKEAEKLIEELAHKYGVVYEAEPMKAVFDRLDEENSEFIYIISRIAVIIMVISVILINCQQIVNYMNRRREYGILYAQGLNQKDVLFLVLGETTVLFGGVLLLSMLMMKGVNYLFWDKSINEVAFLAARKIIYSYVYPVQLLLSAVNTFISTIFIYRVIKAKTPVELIREEN